MAEEKKDSPNWKVVIGLGVLELIWVLIERKLGSLWLSMSTALVMLLILITSCSRIAMDYRNGYRKSAGLCAIGVLFQAAVLVSYVVLSIDNILSIFR